MNQLAIRPSDVKRGYIYAVKNDDSNAVKIGFSKNPHRRIKQLQTSSPAMLRVLLCMPGTLSFEASMHRRFANEWVGGEWFSDASGRVSGIISAMNEAMGK